MPDFIPNQNTPNFRSIRSEPGEQRAMFAPHHILDDGMIRIVYPASGMTLGSMRAEGSEDYQPTVRIDHASGPTSLVFVPTSEEMKALGGFFLEVAAQMEKDADDMLARTLSKRDGGPRG